MNANFKMNATLVLILIGAIGFFLTSWLTSGERSRLKKKVRKAAKFKKER